MVDTRIITDYFIARILDTVVVVVMVVMVVDMEEDFLTTVIDMDQGFRTIITVIINLLCYYCMLKYIIIISVVVLLVIMLSGRCEHYGGGALTQLYNTNSLDHYDNDKVVCEDGLYIGKYPYYKMMFNMCKKIDN